MTHALRDAIARLRRRIGSRSSGCEHHNRGLARFDEVLRSAALATLTDQISERLTRGRRVSVLEIGCGEGRLLLDLLGRFEGGVELHGINHERWPVVTGARGLRATNARYRILPPETSRRLPSPTIHLADAQNLSRFPARDFDFVVSQVVLAHVARKDKVLEESARLLAPGGVFLHEIDHLGEHPDFMDADLPRFTIYEGGAKISTTAYLASHGIEVRIGRAAGPAIALATFRKGNGALDLGLRLDESSTIVLKSVVTLDPEAHLWGVRSVYQTGERGLEVLA